MSDLTQVDIELISQTHPDYEDQSESWDRMEDLYVGQDRIKERAEHYLPPTEIEAAESSRTKKRYADRLNSAIFYNGIDRLTKYAVGHIYRKPPSFHDEFPEKLKPMLLDADLMGTPFDVYARRTSSYSYVMGHYFILVDAPSSAENRAEESGFRPYFVNIHPSQVINWQMERKPNGTYKFVFAVIRETKYESEDATSDTYENTYYKVWYEDSWELWQGEKKKVTQTAGTSNKVTLQPDESGGKATKVKEGVNPLGEVPLIPVYSQLVRPMVSKPPLDEAAALNLHHYQQYSHFQIAIKYHLSPILVLSGVNKVDDLQIGSRTAVIVPRYGDVKYAEYQGSSLDIAKNNLDSIATEMWESGMRSNNSLGVNTSADARRVSRSDFVSWLSAVATFHDRGYSEAFRMAAKWLKIEMPEIPAGESLVNLNRDFDLTVIEANMAEFLLNARKAGELPKTTFFEELVRGGVLEDGTDIDNLIAEGKKDLEGDLETLEKMTTIQNKGSEPKESPKGDSSETPDES